MDFSQALAADFCKTVYRDPMMVPRRQSQTEIRTGHNCTAAIWIATSRKAFTALSMHGLFRDQHTETQTSLETGQAYMKARDN